MRIEKRPITLLVLDGWGYREDPKDNAIAHAHTPVWDKLWAQYPHTLISASEDAVGLPRRQMGNSEVGHLNLGAGRVVFQETSRIANAIESGEFQRNPVLTKTLDELIANGKALHVLGLLSDGGVHSHEQQIRAMIDMAAKRGVERIYLHAFLDGRDAPPKSAEAFIRRAEDQFKALGRGRFASVIGRYFAMDRDNRWERVEQAYRLIAQGQAAFSAPSAQAAVEAAYARGESDEFIQATTIHSNGQEPVQLQDGDAIVFMNFRSDRARQLTRAFADKDFDPFDRGTRARLSHFVTLTQYHADFAVEVAFPPTELHNVFGEYIAKLGLKQLRIAETEKYAHVTFFLNGGVDEPFPGEDRILVPSPKVATYDLQPEMNAPQLTEQLTQAIRSGRYDVIICNYANPDMVGHTGNFEATVKAIEVLDGCIGQVVDALREVGGEALITADHGNAELMRNEITGQAHTAHTTNPVPFLYVGRPARLASGGALSDVTPTMLYLMGLDKPEEMDGRSLVQWLE